MEGKVEVGRRHEQILGNLKETRVLEEGMDLSKDRLQNDNDNAIMLSLDEHVGSIYRL
jgi:hypothetical protein